MRFYKHRHKYYCGIDLHTSMMYVCITDASGSILVHRNLRTNPETFAGVVEPYREDLAVGVECVFVWYWIADLCEQLGVSVVLGHALYMKAIHGGKVKNDRIDSEKIAQLLRSGMLPVAYAYPKEMRSTRDLLRRRLYLVRKQSELLGHIQNTRHQYNLPVFEKRIDRACNRNDLHERFDDPMVADSIDVDSQLLDVLHRQIHAIELQVTRQARYHDPSSVALLRTIPGVGITLALTILYEIGDTPIDRKEANLFFNLVSKLYERASIIITSNKGFEEWAEMMGDEIMTTAMLDRLLHHAHIYALDGESYRVSKSQQTEKEEEAIVSV